MLFKEKSKRLVTTGWIFDISLCENSTINQSINHSAQPGLLMSSVATGSVRRTFFGTWLPLPALTPARPMSRLKWLGRIERDVRASWERPSGRPTSFTLRSFPAPPLVWGDRNIPTFAFFPWVAPRTLFPNHIKGVVPTGKLLSHTEA